MRSPPALAPLLCSEERQEVMLVVRGTFTVEDAFLDMLATGVGGVRAEPAAGQAAGWRPARCRCPSQSLQTSVAHA